MEQIRKFLARIRSGPCSARIEHLYRAVAKVSGAHVQNLSVVTIELLCF